jgi:mono/diheme cytochrome c family protein
VIVGFTLCFAGQSYSQSVVTPAQDPLAGSRVFGSKGCAKCHAVNGVGAKVGPDLGRIQANRFFNDLAAAMWNHLPAMAAKMKELHRPFAQLDSAEAGDLIAFLFTQNYFEGAGNVDSGKKLFNRKGCIQCHQIGGVGGVLGPSLDAVGQSGAPMNVAAAMWNHGPTMAEAMRARGIERPNLNASELRDLVAYLRAAAPERAGAPVSILPGRVNEGRALFEKKQCIKCHSIQGKGVNIGPDLGRRGLYRNLVEFAAALWNKAPAMLRAMKLRKFTVPQLNGEEMADIVAYLRSFQYFGEPGNPDRGRQLLWEKQCLNCHSLDGRGGKGAPDLASVKGLGSPAAVIAALWSHGDFMVEPAPERSLSWPQLKSDEVAHLMAFFERSTRSER